VISVAANIVPGVMAEICKLFFAGEVAKSNALALKYFDLMNKLFIEVNPIPVKKAMQLMDLDSGILRLPLYEMSSENTAILREAMINMGLKLK
ncbi:MAG: dihydrodipicolinate synthase family protein, partial [Christensenella sp.]